MFPYLAPIVLLLFVTGSVSSTVGEMLHLTASAAPIAHSEDAPRSDAGDCGHSSGSTCPCTCCPGHGGGFAFVTQRFSLEIPPSSEFATSLHEDLHPKDVLSRIFHPPRA